MTTIPNKCKLSHLILRSYLIFLIINVISIITLDLLCKSLRIGWGGIEIYSIFTLCFYAPVNTIVSMVLYSLNINTRILTSKYTIGAESILCFILTMLFSYHDMGHIFCIFCATYAIVIALLVLQKFISRICANRIESKSNSNFENIVNDEASRPDNINKRPVRNIKLILISIFIVVLLSVITGFFVFGYSFGKGIEEDWCYEHDKCDLIVRDWYFTGTVDQSDSEYLYIILDSCANVYLPLPMTYFPPLTLIKGDSIILKLHRSGYPSLYAPIGAQVVKNKGSDSVVIGTQTIDLLP